MNTSDHHWQDTVALSVHQAVTDYTQSTGLGNCDLYALAGVILLRDITKIPYQLQLGSMMYLADPAGHGWFEINARDGGLDRLEYHAWIARAGTVVTPTQGDKPALCEVGEMIDFSVRHFRSMTEKLQGIKSATRVGDSMLLEVDLGADRIEWTRPENPPDYLWCAGPPPDEYRYTPDYNCMVAYNEILKQNPKLVMRIRTRVLSYYHNLITLSKEETE